MLNKINCTVQEKMTTEMTRPSENNRAETIKYGHFFVKSQQLHETYTHVVAEHEVPGVDLRLCRGQFSFVALV